MAFPHCLNHRALSLLHLQLVHAADASATRERGLERANLRVVGAIKRESSTASWPRAAIFCSVEKFEQLMGDPAPVLDVHHVPVRLPPTSPPRNACNLVSDTLFFMYDAR